jgi:hypothetical protein
LWGYNHRREYTRLTKFNYANNALDRPYNSECWKWLSGSGRNAEQGPEEDEAAMKEEDLEEEDREDSEGSDGEALEEEDDEVAYMEL